MLFQRDGHVKAWAFGLLLVSAPWSILAADRNAYLRTDLVSNQSGGAPTTDPKLVNAWGLVFNPYGPAWVADNGTGVSTLYDGQGTKVPLEVTIPGQKPTGVVYFGGTSGFPVNGTPSRFIFASETGTLDAWAPPLGNTAVTVARTAGAIYKGLALAGNGRGFFLYATDFHNGRIDVYDANFKPVNLPLDPQKPTCNFSDPQLPAGYAPFGIQTLNGNLYVTYAKQDPNKEDDVPGVGNGFVDLFDPNGCLLSRLARRGRLNSPWGLVIAPANFGRFGNHLLVGNFGDGAINAFDPVTHAFRGQLRGADGRRLTIDGLWALVFGNGTSAQPTSTLFFTAGPDEEANGRYGKIEPAP
ncbi:TIGR03118 family protein [Candidatus Methylocalor cossyra]|uniref:TIGR03118 family protein n=1 Tax=Candidatus Methylocalor cossyra TaxID=3108543 RepID=A0ABM9NJW8_9GAMM